MYQLSSIVDIYVSTCFFLMDTYVPCALLYIINAHAVEIYINPNVFISFHMHIDHQAKSARVPKKYFRYMHSTPHNQRRCHQL